MTTEELLNEMEREAELHSEETPVCVIDPETRTITVPPEYQLFGVENDKRVERICFQCPKIVGDNQDLSQGYQLFINYQNANGDPDAYHIEDMIVEDDNITFSWLLEENVTKYRGNIQFAFGAIKPGDEAEDPDKNRWNTTINTDCTCLVGLKSTQQVAESNPDALAQIWTAIDELKAGGHIFQNTGSHNSMFRGKNLGTQVTDAQYQAIQAGTFDDLYIGDYWVIGGVTWLIAGFDYYYGCGDTAFNKHHAVIVPLSPLYNHAMNETNTTDGGYAGSLMYTEGLEQAKTQIQQAFGAEHVLSHRIYLINATSSGGEWYDSTVDLMNENMVYGCMIFAVANISTEFSQNYRIEKSQLPLFAMYPYASFNRSSFWLRDTVSSSAFAAATNYGGVNSYGASGTYGVRPAFCIGI